MLKKYGLKKSLDYHTQLPTILVGKLMKICIMTLRYSVKTFFFFNLCEVEFKNEGIILLYI